MKTTCVGLAGIVLAPLAASDIQENKIQRFYTVPIDHTSTRPCGEIAFSDDFEYAKSLAGKEGGIIYTDMLNGEIIKEGWAIEPTGKIKDYYKSYERRFT